MLSDMLRDRLVCGTSNKRRLLLQADLTFDKAMEVTGRGATPHTRDRRYGSPAPSQTPPPSQIPEYTMSQQRKPRNNAPRQRGSSTPPPGITDPCSFACCMLVRFTTQQLPTRI